MRAVHRTTKRLHLYILSLVNPVLETRNKRKCTPQHKLSPPYTVLCPICSLKSGYLVHILASDLELYLLQRRKSTQVNQGEKGDAIKPPRLMLSSTQNKDYFVQTTSKSVVVRSVCENVFRYFHLDRFSFSALY